ncbi:patatin-like phospholipase family protein [Rugamonas apoptosis]|uniref:patatin-like phospholipase family protein n=1 Tax=Rugamonas apoptosis TaxID=2758570 RepID=UPI001C716ED9|nr:patatin-like phospholipase family protein [Rugamonas apoptosis]
MADQLQAIQATQADAQAGVPPLDFDAVKALEHGALGLGTAAAASAAQGVGLALSGGGIRSATFGLGVLQALAARQALDQFDYLSTVSGGGYIGAWLSAWIHRAGLEQVQAALGRAGGGPGAAPHTLEPEQVSWLRRYSNYLTPRVGLFSVDSLTLITIWTRNVTLSLIIVLAFFAVLLLLPRLALLYVTGLIDTPPVALGYLAGLMGAGVLPAVLVANMVELERPTGVARFRLATTPAVLWTVLPPGVLAALSGSFWLFGPDPQDGAANRAIALWSAALLLLVGLGWLLCKLYHALRYAHAPVRAASVRAALLESAVFLPSGAAGIAAGMAVLAVVHARLGWETGTAHAAAVLTFGPALFMLVFGAGGSIFVGLVGRNYFERSREWWSRMNAWFLIVGAAWLTLHGCAFYLPALTQWAYANAGPWLRGAVGAGWLASVIGLLLAPRQGNGDPRRHPRLLTVAKLAAALFLLGFVAAAASLTDSLLVSAGRLTRTAVEPPAGMAVLDWHLPGAGAGLSARIDVAGVMPGLGAHVAARMADLHGLLQVQAGPLPFLWLAFAGVAAVLLVFGLRVDVNKFSLHNMYKTRLIRCYLGASNPHRRAQPFTGFDDGDDVALSSLADGGTVQRPMHIINTTLNLSQGKNLAWQERKAASFTLTALYSGFALGQTQGVSSEQHAKTRLVRPEQALAGDDEVLAGYRPTRLYAASNGETRAFTLGMAAATSGAAASPNMGAATSPALAFLMTLLNVRIGRWSPNPARKSWRRASPGFGLLCLLQELFGYSNDESTFVYLSDGGHFDNTGIYELVRRRCRLILLVDASEDGQRGFDDLGRAIRQCRIDFGVEIRIDLGALRSCAPDLPAAGHARGEILYGSGAAEGELLYIKPTLCAARREPVDVLNYSSNHPSFPHQSPADQFFDESQFESYRQLGLHLAGACLDQHGHLLSNASRHR